MVSLCPIDGSVLTLETKTVALIALQRFVCPQGDFLSPWQAVGSDDMTAPLDANAKPVAASGGGGATDVTDRAGRLLGKVTVDNLPATQPVSGSVSITGTVPVSGTFWQATQPVSGSVSVSNFPATQPVSGTVTANTGLTQPLTDAQLRATAVPVSGTVGVSGTVPVSGTFWQATQPVSGTVGVSNFPATQAVSGTVGVNNFPATQAVSGTVTVANPTPVATLAVTGTAATGVALTLTLPAVAGQFHYIAALEFTLYATAARTGSATPIVVTSTNLPGSPAWTFPTAQAIGTTVDRSFVPAFPVRSSVAGTATTIVAPVAAAGIWRITAFYYTAV